MPAISALRRLRQEDHSELRPVSLRLCLKKRKRGREEKDGRGDKRGGKAGWGWEEGHMGAWWTDGGGWMGGRV
jgi:hypothetical protein